MHDLTFLVIEDHDFQRRAMSRMLTALGAGAVHTASDGRSALQVISDRAKQIDIVICDLSMSGMDGVEFVQHLGTDSRETSVIIVSALAPDLLASVVEVASGYAPNLLGAVKKPLVAENLLPLVQAHDDRIAAARTHVAAQR